MKMRDATAPQHGAKSGNTEGLFSFDGASLDPYALRKGTHQPPRKVLASGVPPPSSMSASLQRKPHAALAAALDAGRSRAKLDSEEPSSPLRPRTALGRALSPPGSPKNGPGGPNGPFDAPQPQQQLQAPLALQSEGLAQPPSPPPPRKVSNLEALMAAEKAPSGSPAGADASGHFANLLLLSELRTAEDGAQYFLKRQSHKFPVKFLHLVCAFLKANLAMY
jgi:hypothetical protein